MGANLGQLAGQLIGDRPDVAQGFVVSVTRGGRCRRLHFAGGCFRIAGEHCKNFECFGQAMPDDHLFNLRYGRVADQNGMQVLAISLKL